MIPVVLGICSISCIFKSVRCHLGELIKNGQDSVCNLEWQNGEYVSEVFSGCVRCLAFGNSFQSSVQTAWPLSEPDVCFSIASFMSLPKRGRDWINIPVRASTPLPAERCRNYKPSLESQCPETHPVNDTVKCVSQMFWSTPCSTIFFFFESFLKELKHLIIIKNKKLKLGRKWTSFCIARICRFFSPSAFLSRQ